MADNLFDEWASGVSLANTNTNDFFEEIPLELNKPADFTVNPEQIPTNPTETPAPAQTEPPVVAAPSVESDQPETRKTKKGGTITLEKTSRGWRAVINNGVSNIAEENFYGSNKDELIFNICEAKVEANLAIHKFKKEKLLGGEDKPIVSTVEQRKPVNPKVSVLSADDVYEIKNKLNDNPSEAFDAWVKKRFGLDPDELAEALKSAPEARRIVEAQKIKSDIDEINYEFVNQNPDWSEEYASNPDNLRKLVARMSKAHIGKKITDKTPQTVVDDTIYELFSRGFWTVENLETAKEELIESGLLERSESHRPAPPPQPQQVATPPSSPSVPVPPRIAEQTGTSKQPVGLGISAKTSAPASVPEEKPLSDVDLQNMPLDKLKELAIAQMRSIPR